ncbi:MAG: 50S ribosomal protein L21 [Candidatus Wildermuthbacteria bacterium]|nr:50S ribosomal protein L21 [Candidatus Wildermuthbacteria bacterium]
MLAVIKTGGKQYIVSPGKKIKIEKLEIEDGKEIIFNEVLLLEQDNKVEIGTPFIENAKVTGKVLRQGKADKVISLRYKAKKRVHVKRGHRQKFTEVEIKSFSAL